MGEAGPGVAAARVDADLRVDRLERSSDQLLARVTVAVEIEQGHVDIRSAAGEERPIGVVVACVTGARVDVVHGGSVGYGDADGEDESQAPDHEITQHGHAPPRPGHTGARPTIRFFRLFCWAEGTSY